MKPSVVTVFAVILPLIVHAEGVLVPDQSVGLFEGANKSDIWDSWSSTHQRMLALWTLDSKNSKQLYNRATDSHTRGDSLAVLQKGLFSDYIDWAKAETTKVVGRIREKNKLDIDVRISENLNPYQQALFYSRFLDSLRAHEKTLKAQPNHFGSTHFVLAPSSAMLAEANGLMRQQFAAYPQEMAQLSDGHISTLLLLKGRNAKFKLEPEGSVADMRLLRDMLQKENLTKSFGLDKKGPFIQVTFDRPARVTVNGNLESYQRGESKIFRLKNTDSAKDFVSFMQTEDGKNASIDWTAFNYSTKAFRAQAPDLHIEDREAIVTLSSSAGENVRIARVLPSGNFIIGDQGVSTFSREELLASPYIVVSDVDEILNVSQALSSAQVEKTSNDEQEILKRLKSEAIVPQMIQPHPAIQPNHCGVITVY